MISEFWIKLAIKVVGWGIGKYFANTEAKKSFVKMVAEMERGGLSSVKLRQDYRTQIEEARKRGTNGA